MAIEEDGPDRRLLVELGERLARLRLARDLTQEALADEAGVGLNTLRRMEAGNSTQVASLVRVLRALGLVERFEDVVPGREPSPLAELDGHTVERRRASSAGRRRNEPRDGWTWGEDAGGDGA